MNIKWDLTGLPLKTREFLRKQRDEATVKALLAANERQRQLAAHFRNNPTQARNGFGGQTMVFDPVVMAGLRREAGAQGGEDREIQKHYARKYPGLYTTRHRPTRLQVGYGSTPELASRDVKPTRPGVKFMRVYETKAAEEQRGKGAEEICAPCPSSPCPLFPFSPAPPRPSTPVPLCPSTP